MRLTAVGVAGSYPSPASPCSCYLLEAEGFRLVVDLGNGALGNLQRVTDIDAVDAVLLSHLHADHCLDVCSYYVARRYRPGARLPLLDILGPDGTSQRIADAYGAADPARLADYFRFLPIAEGERQVGPFRVTARRTAHPVEAYALRFEHAGRVLAYSGDSGPCDALVDIARDADAFLCEASFRDGDENPPDLHLTATEAAEVALRAGARRLYLTHIPAWVDPVRQLEAADRSYPGRAEVLDVLQVVDLS